MPYSTKRGTDGADRYRVRNVDSRLADIEDDLDSGVIGGGGGGGGAPTGAAYVTIGANATLTAERALTAGAGIAITDGGANSTVTIAASGDAADLTSGTIPAARMPALTGDVTMTAGTTTTAIAANAVVNADLADMAVNTIKGRISAGTGDPEDLTAAQARTVIGAPQLVKSILSATQANSTLTPAVLNGCTFTLLPGQSLTLDAILIFTAAATTTGGALGIRVAQAAGASANAIGAAHGYVNLSNAAAATGLADGDNFVVTAGTNVFFEVLGTATTAGDNAAHIKAVVHNPAAAHNTTVTVEFRSEVNTSAVTAQIGSGAVALIG